MEAKKYARERVSFGACTAVFCTCPGTSAKRRFAGEKLRSRNQRSSADSVTNIATIGASCTLRSSHGPGVLLYFSAVARAGMCTSASRGASRRLRSCSRTARARPSRSGAPHARTRGAVTPPELLRWGGRCELRTEATSMRRTVEIRFFSARAITCMLTRRGWR